MRLMTPKEVHTTQFDVRHIRGGYDIDQVDELLDDLEWTIRVLSNEVASRRTQPRKYRNRRNVRRWND